MHKKITGEPSRSLPPLPSSVSPTDRTAPGAATQPAMRSRSPAFADLPASRTGGAARVSAGPAKISDAELSLAVYLLARAVDGRPVAAPEISRLRLANASVNETRQLLKATLNKSSDS